MSSDVAKILSLCAAMLMLLAACNSNDGNSASNPSHTTAKALRIGVIPVDECLPLYVAEHLGLLDSLHADVKVMHYDALSECRQALAEHKVDAIIADSAISYKLLTAKKARLHRISQFSDKVIAADGEGYSKHLVEQSIDSLLKLKRHIFIIKVEDLNVRTKMLTSSNIDAAILPEPWASRAKKAGAVELKIETRQPKNTTPFPTVKNDKLRSALAIASDSINKYGKKNYQALFER